MGLARVGSSASCNKFSTSWSLGNFFTVVEEKYGEKVPIAFYSVKYLLGGSEKNVRETYISCTQEDGEARKVLPRDIFTVPLEEVGAALVVPLRDALVLR